MTTRERPRTAREALDETDVERAIADERPPDEATAGDLRGETGEELEWRIAAEDDEDTAQQEGA